MQNTRQARATPFATPGHGVTTMPRRATAEVSPYGQTFVGFLPIENVFGSEPIALTCR